MKSIKTRCEMCQNESDIAPVTHKVSVDNSKYSHILNTTYSTTTHTELKVCRYCYFTLTGETRLTYFIHKIKQVYNYIFGK